MTDTADLLRGLASAMWVVLGFLVLLTLRRILAQPGMALTRFGVGASGVSMEFAEKKLNEATQRTEHSAPVGDVAKKGVLRRVQRNADLLSGARVLWADDHPENNLPIIELLRRFDAAVDTPRSNNEALSLLDASRYDVVISDVGRDNEGERAGLELARAVFERHRQRTILFTGLFDPATVPGLDEQARLQLSREVSQVTFGRTNRFDEALHLIIDVLERERC